MLDTLLDWEAGWISFFKFLTNHDVYIMKFLYVWHFLRQSDIWFIGTGGLSDCVKIQSIKHMWSNTNLMEPPALRHGPPDGGWDSMVAKLQSHILLGPTAQRWVFWIVESFGVGTTSLRSMNGTKPAVAVDKNGVKRFAGKKKELKQSQKLGYQHQELHMFSLGFSKCFTDFTDWSPQRFWKRNGIPFSNKYFMGHTSSTNQQLCFYKTSGYL